jgi:serine/threonine-protein kinase ULK4
MKEKDPYVQQCMEALVQTIVGVIPGILESIATDIVNLTSAKRANTTGLGAAPLIGRGSARSSIPLFPVVLQLMNSPTFRTRVIDGPVLAHLASFLKRLETSSFQVSSGAKVLGINDLQSNGRIVEDCCGILEVAFPELPPNMH